jgi:hypothetical protein
VTADFYYSEISANCVVANEPFALRLEIIRPSSLSEKGMGILYEMIHKTAKKAFLQNMHLPMET